MVARKRSAFVITETELKLIANAAIIGESKIPKNGNPDFSARLIQATPPHRRGGGHELPEMIECVFEDAI